MRYLVLSEYEAERYIPSDKTAIIRIYQGSEEELNPLVGTFDSEIQLQYHDIYFKDMYTGDEEELKKFGIVPYSNEVNSQLWKFLDKVKDYDTIVVHCAMGLSRSPSVGIAISWYYNHLWFEKWICQQFDMPNSYLLNHFAKDLGVTREYLKYDKQDLYLEYQKEIAKFGGRELDCTNDNTELLF